jgi:hypothetical protein
MPRVERRHESPRRGPANSSAANGKKLTLRAKEIPRVGWEATRHDRVDRPADT